MEENAYNSYPHGCLRGEAVEGGGAVSAEGGDVAISSHGILASDLSVQITDAFTVIKSRREKAQCL
jgi:hypothetical protein